MKELTEGLKNGFHIRKFRALATRTFIAILIMSLLIGCAGFWIGHQTFVTILAWETKDDVQSMTRAEHTAMYTEKTREITSKILEIYDSIPDEEKGDGTSEEYRARFDSVYGEDYDNIKSVMYQIRKNDSMRGFFVAAFSKEKDGRLIYLIDDDPNPETFCPPGTWDTYDQSLIDSLVEGSPPTTGESILGLKQPIRAAWSERRGNLICTGADELYETDRYHVMICMDKNLNRMVKINRIFTRVFAMGVTVAAFLIAFIMMHVFRRRVVSPINQLADAAASYSRDKENDMLVGGHFSGLDIKTGDEIENLSVTMKEMENDMTEYVRDLTAMTAEKGRIETELDLARRLQAGVIPDTFPAFPEHEEFTLHAYMEPARGVAGDFYDYYMIDDDHLVLTIADVSGKGMPAALFMMSSQIKLRDYVMAAAGESPADVLMTVNDQLCERNSLEMFVTVWLGILELSTGRLIAANAGHEYPALKRGDSFEIFKDKHGFVLGGMEGVKYENYELKLEPGDTIFQYTDGVTEATDADEQLFGTERMLEALNKDSTADPEQILANINDGIESFVKDAEQFDDITMICLKYNGK